MEIFGNVEKTVERILSKLVGAELSAEELEQVAGGSQECVYGTWGDDGSCDQF